MRAFKVTESMLLVPKRAEGPGGLVGDGWALLRRGEPDFEAWLPYVEPMPASMHGLVERMLDAERAALQPH